MRLARWDEIMNDHERREVKMMNRVILVDEAGRFMSVRLNNNDHTAIIPGGEFHNKDEAAYMMAAFGYLPIVEVDHG